MGQFRLVATDLDGTLLRDDGTISPYTAEVLRQVDDRGVLVVFVTGRPLRWARDVFDHVGAHGLAVLSNGALVWDVAADRPVELRCLEPAAGLEVCTRIREAVPGSAFAVETLAGISLEEEFLERHPIPDGSRRGPIADLFTEPAVKVLARHEELGHQEFWDLAAEAVGDLAVITWSSTSALLEISAAGVDKGAAVAALCASRGIAPDEVLVFGDMPNDLPLMAWAGTSYAPSNAHPTVLAAADHRAPANGDDGVARVLSGLFRL